MSFYLEDLIEDFLTNKNYEKDFDEDLEDFIYNLIEYLEDFFGENLSESLDNVEDTIFRIFVDKLGEDYTKEIEDQLKEVDRANANMEEIKSLVIDNMLQDFSLKILEKTYEVMKELEDEELGTNHCIVALTKLNSVRERILKMWDIIPEEETK